MAVQVYVWLLCLVCGNFVPVKRLARLNPSQLNSIPQKTGWHLHNAVERDFQNVVVSARCVSGYTVHGVK